LLCALFLQHFTPLVTAGHVYVAMPPLYRIDVGKKVFYALDEEEKNALIKRITKKDSRAKCNVQRFKGLGEMNTIQLRETTMAQDTRRLVQLTIDSKEEAFLILDMLLSKKRAADRRKWLEDEGDKAEIIDSVNLS
jgi:topoisomerase-4 subunit B